MLSYNIFPHKQSTAYTLTHTSLLDTLPVKPGLAGFPPNSSFPHILFNTILPSSCWPLDEAYTPWTIKKCHFVFDYNSGFSWSIFKLFVPAETGRNSLQKVNNKIYHFTLTVPPHYLVKLKPRINSTFWSQSSQCVRSNQLFTTFAESRQMFVFVNFFGRNFFYQSSNSKTFTFSGFFFTKNV